MRLIVVALDGFDVNLLSLDEFANLNNIYAKNPSSILMSTIPYMTPSAFASMQTGKNVGGHGISGFLKFDGVTKSKPYNGSDLKEKTFYEILHDYGRKCFLMGMPYSSPPRIDGDLVFDWLSGKSHNGSLIHPSSLVDKFPQLANIGIYPEFRAKFTDYMKSIRKITRHTLDCMLDIVRADMHDFCFFYIQATDEIQHPLLPDIMRGEKNESVTTAKAIFSDIDTAMAKMVATLKSDDALIIMSDHGFATYDYQFFINDWLNENGYLYYGSSDQLVDARSLYVQSDHNMCSKRRMKTLRIPTSVSRFVRKHRTLFRIAYSVRQNLERKLGSSIIDSPPVDMQKSVAVSFEAGEGGIYLNKQLLSPHEVENLKAEIATKLSSIDGLTAYDRNELYRDSKANGIADVYITSSKYYFGKGSGGTSIDNIPGGDHRREGVVMMIGDIFEKAPISPQLTDIAPTLLHIMDTPIPTDIHGRILSETFASSSRPAQRKTRFIDPAKSRIQEETALTPSEQEIVEENLRRLGYI
jgi:predicted AlkP superfamily phosphohydrolase/phosphomutase